MLPESIDYNCFCHLIARKEEFDEFIVLQKTLEDIKFIDFFNFRETDEKIHDYACVVIFLVASVLAWNSLDKKYCNVSRS